MGIKTKFKQFFELDDETIELDEQQEQDSYMEEEEPEVTRANRKQSKQNVVSLQSVHKNSRVVLVEPRVYAEAQDIADHVKNRKSVVMNLQRIPQDQARRIVDFLSGTVYAVGGDIQKLGPDTFICTPDNVEISGNITDEIYEDQ
ncbi:MULTISPECIES: cell division protein SepF [Bacillales]|uniref:cell division protein SepF n=1 Tax=Bacillales TaxID=1385 RepID=UPI0018836D69|nr:MULTISPECIES: cell division protein SepF [Bacillaceae]MBF0708368.1 cell division protein SepF [Pseudalkalibacillus hwajinpoensis]MDO6655558.1 cell division protein SepF [Anaerobacillus sp. 1_MG-2023]WLR59684.1 cell division protein SepF [Pseudalkalibacillus hwajinpoensis]